jgi:hypothetical protein
VHGTTSAPVVEAGEPGRLIGMVDLAQLLHGRRWDHHEEHHRERHLSARVGRSVNVPRRNEPADVAETRSATTLSSEAR